MEILFKRLDHLSLLHVLSFGSTPAVSKRLENAQNLHLLLQVQHLQVFEFSKGKIIIRLNPDQVDETFKQIHTIAKNLLPLQQYQDICSSYSSFSIDRYFMFNQNIIKKNHLTPLENQNLLVFAEALQKQIPSIPLGKNPLTIRNYLADPANSDELKKIKNLDLSKKRINKYSKRNWLFSKSY
jgi:hypothetical protein